MARKDEKKFILIAVAPILPSKNIFANSIKKGYPGGWHTPRVYAAVIISGESLFAKAGYKDMLYIYNIEVKIIASIIFSL